ncbi:hypothetical protein LOK49_LG12G01456 [Camellia lanceoleosa]|uniref:Uncharacterized protein n=1 Tax=Camellia lanceoleosa TaxID=1840588 RepID=A0ACC0FT22_9ERIC|nr:hypothetical protein LOK49_LG12G01456 [Camellia lanceoleosa]
MFRRSMGLLDFGKDPFFDMCVLCCVHEVFEFTGDYEYIDVLMEDINGGGDETVRLIVDMDFRSQFELARPTSTYSELTASLPSIFVGSEEKLMEIICLVCLANNINNFLKTTQRWNLDLVVLFSYCQV